ncbi:MAG: hypothetical protein OdinLCB4_000865 [Candidatus Odinarchaeum yellowstonii]|uniref:Zinc ribbon domain-containing protein n=1 Tax=Odinarchaeota yellowstonii (strain LCB_4) TaxID=1841599 RepID=A0AAF0D2I4_ODILC|nr:MAG: hypothetical protein OdinLCB4_000865 [Candidatus Odinarchaeum yellowstonii]
MGLGRLLLISLLALTITSLLSYFITPDIAASIYASKYQFQGAPELGYFIAVLESIIQGLREVRVTIIVASTSLLAGLLYSKKNSWIAGVFAYTMLLILLLIFYYRFFNMFKVPEPLTFFTNILFTITIAACSSSIPGIAAYLKRREHLERIQVYLHEKPSTICPSCGAEYDSKPLICVKCGFNLNQTSEIRLDEANNCAN